MNQEQLKKQAKKHFDANDKLDELFLTEDGNSFSTKEAAQEHKRKSNKNITHFTKKMFPKAKNEPQS